MSSVNDVVVKADTLIETIRALIDSDTVAALPEVAAELGIEELFNDGVSALADLIRGLQGEFARLESVIAQLDAISGVVALIEPLVLAIGRMAGEGAEDIGEYGIPAATQVAGEIGEGFSYVETAFTVVQNLSIDADDFHELLAELLGLADDVEALRTDAGEGAEEGQAA